MTHAPHRRGLVRKPEVQQAIGISNDLIAELIEADEIVIGTSMYNFSIPAILKAYIDHIVRIGVTVSPRYEGLVEDKKLTIILASGGDYAPGAHAESANVAVSYLKQSFCFIGITDVKIVLAGGTAVLNKKQITLLEFVRSFDSAIAQAAQA